eukprot:7453794-Alexandrium_andersonii.AAC.1
MARPSLSPTLSSSKSSPRQMPSWRISTGQAFGPPRQACPLCDKSASATRRGFRPRTRRLQRAPQTPPPANPSRSEGGRA